MITIQTIVLTAGTHSEGVFVTEDACKEFVEKYNPKEPILVKLGNSPTNIGKCIKVWYDEEKKVVVAHLVLNLVISSNVNVLKALETPGEKRILSYTITSMGLNLGGVNESK